MTDKKLKFFDGKLEIACAELLSFGHHVENDIVILGGSIVEGLGNIQSDFDVYVICESLPTASDCKHSYVDSADGKIRSSYDYLSYGSLGVDYEYITWAEVNRLKVMIVDKFNAVAKHTKIVRERIVQREEDAVNRIRKGIILSGLPESSAVFDDDTARMLSFIQYRNCVGAYPEFKDMMGSFHAKDYVTCRWHMQNYMLNQVRGLCHVYGNLNSKPKWVFQCLRKLPGNFAQLSSNISSWVLGETLQAVGSVENILIGCDLIDSIWKRIAEELDRSFGLRGNEAIELVEKEYMFEPTKDKQTNSEYFHRCMMFVDSGVLMRRFFVDNLDASILTDTDYMPRFAEWKRK